MGAGGRILLCLGLAVGVAEGAFEVDGWESLLPLQEGGWAGNPAALSGAPCRSWRLAYYRPFALEQLGYRSLAVRWPGAGWGLEGVLASFGFDLHREVSGRIGGGVRWRHWAAGGELGFGQLSGGGVGSRGGFSWGVGAQLLGWGPWELGVWRHSGPQPWRAPRLYVQVAYRHGDGSVLRGHWRRLGGGGRLDLAGGRWLGKGARLELGTRTGPRRFAAGLETRMRRWSGYYWVKVHPYLGLSQGLAVGNACQSSWRRPHN